MKYQSKQNDFGLQLYNFEFLLCNFLSDPQI